MLNSGMEKDNSKIHLDPDIEVPLLLGGTSDVTGYPLRKQRQLRTVESIGAACLAVYRRRASHRGLPPVSDEDPGQVVQALDLSA